MTFAKPLALLVALLVPVASSAAELTIFAAASLKTALDEAAEVYQTETAVNLRLSYAGSSALARQISFGAPTDIFISANIGWMDHLEAEGLLVPDTRTDLLGNSLVLIAPKGQTAGDIPTLVQNAERIAMALVDAVPAGIYGKTALTDLNLWETAAPKVVQADNVRAALALVALGEAPLGVVYGTDALAEPKVTIVAQFPPHSHTAIRYPAALIDGRDTQEGRAFLTWLGQDAAKDIFSKHGFTPLRDE
ncbi:molybdate ABC transporter substrate-binding protein [Tropicibacter naphthalenivorans]|uniref:Molybdate-binding periplasmic protein n=1 Tax=Tropicibacter naphthalenivorans TaxID=441103 RepID=A0A0P1GCG5_9RHOB|nr:molybdate ABC transporter substrate-binding protein [Tropicibacter naphthalenivorans]CUH79085.1 Molybdate-binding periplasmic protein precursor [Tropicibacter naphthalenivorans]SMD03559.1 molybdate transport system substrate-binding protein [Tropicibacter naphthalenivorans]